MIESPIYQAKFFIRIFLLLILVFCSPSKGQTSSTVEFKKLGPPFLNYKKLDNVGVGLVSTILHDSSGFIWLVNSEGLHRFDGQSMTLFPGLEQFASPHVEFITEGQDGRIWIATYDKGVAVFDPKSTQLTFVPLSKHLPQAWQELEKIPPVGGIVIRNGELFVAIKDRVIVIDEQSFSLKKVVETSVAESDLITRLLVTSNGEIWLNSYHGSGPMRYDGEVWHSYHHDKDDKSSISSRMVVTFFEDSKQRVWLGTYEGLNLFDPATEKFKRYAPYEIGKSENLVKNIVSSIAEDEQGVLWLGLYEQGLFTFDPDKESFFFMPPVKGIETSILSNQFPSYSKSVFVDQQHTIWAITREGISKLSQQNRQLAQWVNTTEESCLPRSMYESHHGLFFACDNKLFLKQDDQFSLIKTFTDREQNIKVDARAIAAGNGDNIWVATNVDGIYKINLKTKSEKHYQFKTKVQNKFAVNLIWYLAFDQQDRLYAMMGQHPEHAGGAILIYNENTDSFDIVSTGFKNTHFIDVDEKRLLINRAYSKEQQNLFWFDKHQKTLQPLAVNTGEIGAMVKWNNQIIVATEHLGVMSINVNTGAAEKVTTDIDDVVLGFYVMQDKLFASSKKNLYQMTLDKTFSAELSCITCTLSIDLPELNHHQHGQLYWSQSFMSSLGHFYAFTDNSILSIPVDKLNQPEIDEQLTYTELTAMGKKVLPNRENKHVLLTESIERATALTILPNTSLLSFKFTKLGALQPEKIQYAYQLNGLSEEWITTEKGTGAATFSLLPAGNYQLNIRSTDALGHWLSDKKSLTIKVLAPWYQTVYAYVFYAFVAGSIILCFSWLYHRKKLAEKDYENAHALTAAKERLFANLSHEFRTPLTLILGPADAIKKQAQQDVVTRNVNLIERNALKLLSMVDQLLQLAKVREQHEEDVNEQHVKSICDAVVELFSALAQEKLIDFQVSIEVQDNVCLFGVNEALDTILHNVLSNAFKFTPAGGKVSFCVFLQKQQVAITIEDSGCGIPEHELGHIFERFARVENQGANVAGTGIGLALVKELVNKLKGQVFVESTVGQGTKFVLTLPIVYQEFDVSKIPDKSVTDKTHLKPDTASIELSLPVNEMPESAHSSADGDKSVILVVDDNPDICQFLYDSLINEHDVVTAVDGKQAIEFALIHSPDLIISDVMMPQMDGFELLSQIRDNMALCHIPIILLTAKGDEDSKLKGLSELADDYITKPFKPAQLHARIQNLLGLRAIIRRRLEAQFNGNERSNKNVSHQENEHIDNVFLTERDEQFIEKLQALYEQLHSDTTLNLATIAEKLAMSERQLQRKLKALIGATFSESLRDYRLSQAKDLLFKGEQVAVIADKVGFNSSSYFVRCFKAKYGTTPNDFRKKAHA
ncbi:hybrid sensor histidine kinase/response regulator transcription factor [Thalassotalea marina]|uniref:histidine kinase n=1 Tax=Thalassotalea marina TaxID=1673741 RepID=A0A919BKX9_9GAMM|nr:response regulator [Thalassotalea marina]GHF95968.1 hybrid sensor histidine kinase/response regulator [Thalassotalea marina]